MTWTRTCIFKYSKKSKSNKYCGNLSPIPIVAILQNMICCKKSGGAQPTLAVEEPKIKVGAGVRTAPCTIWHPERSTKYPGRRSESLRCTILTRHSRLHNPLLRSLGSSQLKYESQPWENLESVWTGQNNTKVKKKASFQWKRKGFVHCCQKVTLDQIDHGIAVVVCTKMSGWNIEV